MCIKDIIQTLADTKNIVANDIFLDAESSDLLILAWSAKKNDAGAVSVSYSKAEYYNTGHGTRLWRALDIGAGKVFIEAPAPHVCCKKNGVVTAAIPEVRHVFGSARFSRNRSHD